jgi:pimeloyl-ACP methyl ester carboxylesterase
VRAQTLILGSGQDKLVKVKDIEKLSSQLHNSSLVIIEQSGHFVSAEEPTACADAISEFIDRTLRLQTPNI